MQSFARLWPLLARSHYMPLYPQFGTDVSIRLPSTRCMVLNSPPLLARQWIHTDRPRQPAPPRTSPRNNHGASPKHTLESLEAYAHLSLKWRQRSGRCGSRHGPAGVPLWHAELPPDGGSGPGSAADPPAGCSADGLSYRPTCRKRMHGLGRCAWPQNMYAWSRCVPEPKAFECSA
eukprot:1048196-Pelagomonas_calceolata.AAC.7